MRASVLIDTYNHERFIERAINSVLEQDMPLDNIEILVVDDGSTDRTPEIVRRFEPRVRLLRKTNGGQASAFNVGIPQCRGEIIALLDGDDWWTKTKLSRVLAALEENREAGMVGHGLYEHHSDGRREGLILPGRPYRLDLSSQANAELFRHLAAFFGTSRMTIRKAVLDQILPIPEGLTVEADEYIFTLAPAIAPAIIINEPMCHYGMHPGNLYQFGTFDAAKTRRKMNVLEVLLRELPGQLRKRGASEEVIETLFHNTRVDVGRMRLSLEGGTPLQTFAVERAAFKGSYREVTWRYQIFRAFVLMQTLILPPRIFYRLRRWYSERGLSRLRSWTGEPTRIVQVVERRPG